MDRAGDIQAAVDNAEKAAKAIVIERLDSYVQRTEAIAARSLPVVGDEDIQSLDITMDNTLVVKMCYRIGGLIDLITIDMQQGCTR